MSLNIQVVANKCEFSNEFSEGFTCPANTQVALTKCALSVPVFIQNVLKVPAIDAGIRDTNALIVNIDGIVKSITFTDLFNAYRTYEGITNLEPNIDIDDFYSGGYQFFTNNRMYYWSFPYNATRDGDKPSFSWVLGKAINDAYSFYRITDVSKWRSQDVNFGLSKTGSINISLIGRNNHNYDNCSIHCAKQEKISLNARYQPYDITNLTPEETRYTQPNNTNWLLANGQLTDNAGANYCMAVGNEYQVDVNGGFIRVQPNFVGGVLQWGFSLAGRGLNEDGLCHSEGIAQEPVIDLGIEFQATDCYRIITDVVYNHNTAVYEYVFNTSIAMNKFDNNTDYFYIQIQRGSISSNNTNEFIFTLYQGTENLTDYDDTRAVYTWTKTMNSNDIIPTEVCISDGQAGNQLKNMAHIQQSVDSEQMRKIASKYSSGGQSVFSIQPDTDALNPSLLNFWASLGIHSFNKSTAFVGDILLDAQESNFEITTDGTALNKTLSWPTDFKDEDDTLTNASYYWVGEKALRQFFQYTNIVEGDYVGNEQWEFNSQTALSELPKSLNVYINNLDVKNFQGSFYALTDTQTQTGQTRLVSTIPFKVDDETKSQDVYVNYETFNAFYRPINNPNSFFINQLLTEISFKDAETDKKKVINLINGLVRCEYNFRSGTRPKGSKGTELIALF